MEKKILVGTENFDEIIKVNGYYVDKTELLYELVEETTNKVTLFTRPRRFGKTLTMSMIESFFDIRRDSKGIFEGMDVMKHGEFCAEWMNQYPVLFLSLKDVEGLSFENACAMLASEISNLCIKCAYLETEKNVDSADAEIFHRLKFKQSGKEELKHALRIIMRMMNAVYGKQVILLIDEYDVPLAKAHSNGFYRQMLDVIRGLMSTSLKTNEYLKFAVVTGCLRIPKESIFTGVNNFASYSVLDAEFAEYFGFTQEEVEQLLRAFDREENIDIVREWYDGYGFGDTEIYCPWDVVCYMSALRKRRDAKPKAYWENTSGNDAIRAFFEMKNADFTEKFETLLNGGSITENVTSSLTYEEAYDSESNLWSILLMTGYVTTASPKDVDEGEGMTEVALRIPNKEIAAIFRRSVVDHFNKTVDPGRIQELMQAMWEGEEEKASEILSELLWQTISYMDYHEDYYHAFLTGIFVGRGKFAVRSNRERGQGRPDIDLRDRNNRRALLIEAKKSDSKDRMGYWCEKAIRQIADNGYAKGMDGYTKVFCYGISFYKKSAMVRLMK